METASRNGMKHPPLFWTEGIISLYINGKRTKIFQEHIQEPFRALPDAPPILKEGVEEEATSPILTALLPPPALLRSAEINPAM